MGNVGTTGYNTGLTTGYNSGMGTGMGSGIMGTGMGTGLGTGMGTGMGPGMGTYGPTHQIDNIGPNRYTNTNKKPGFVEKFKYKLRSKRHWTKHLILKTFILLTFLLYK